MLEQVQTRKHLARPAHEDLQQRELLCREPNLGRTTRDLPRRRVEAEVADFEDGRPLGIAPADERAQAGEQLRERERLDEVVVGAAVETRDAILDRVPRGQHQHRYPDSGAAQPAAGLEAVQAGQHHVEDDRVVLVRLRHPERVLAVGRHVGGEPLVDETPANQARHPQLVLDDQHAHGFILPPRDEHKMTVP